MQSTMKKEEKAADGMGGEGGGQENIVVVTDLAGLNVGPTRLPEC